MAEESGFRVAGEFYGFPADFRLGDTVLFKEVTGTEWEDFVERAAENEDGMTQTDLLGLVAIAIWQGNPTWDRRKVARYTERLGYGDFEAVGGEGGKDEPSPPEEKVGENESETSASSSEFADTPSDDANQNSSGMPVSVIGSPV